MLQTICREFDEYAGDAVLDGLKTSIQKQIEMIGNIKMGRQNDLKMSAFSKNMKNCFMSQIACPQLKGFGGGSGEECMEMFENKKQKAMKTKLMMLKK